MEKFTFNLQKVLDYKTTIEDQKKQEFVAAQKTYLKEEEVLSHLISEKESVQSSGGKYKSILEYQTFIRYIDFMDSRIDQQKQILESAKKALDLKKEELVKSTSDRKVLEKLKEKAKAEFDFEVSRNEQKLNDDFGLFSYIRNERG